ncbi:MAG: hypothetical protein LC745_07740 [Planctomycetia bacterium]|nr:hypothetical protein [Planctomycetia bacterium]
MTPAPNSNLPRTAKEARECVALREAGVSVKALARKYGRTVQSVRNHLRKSGFRARPPLSPPERGESVREYAERIGLTRKAALLRYRRYRRSPGCTRDTRHELAAGRRNWARGRAAAMGWPEADTPRQARLLSALAGGEWTRAFVALLAARIERSHGARAIRDLAARGLVETRGAAKNREYRIAPWLAGRRAAV